MTKLFETEADLDRERTTIMAFAAFTDSIPFKMPMESEIDYLMVRDNQVKAAVEIKCRANAHDKYEQYLLSNKKYDSLCRWAEFGIVPFLLIKWSDEIGYVKCPVEHEKSVGGRYDRGPTIGVEPIVLIDIAKFRMI